MPRLTLRGDKRRGCEDGCSFYVEEYDFSGLRKEEQIEIEETVKGAAYAPEGDVRHLRKLVFDAKVHRCVGGLLEDGKPRTSCPYFTQLPDAAEDPTAVFVARYAAGRELPWKISTAILGTATVILALATYLRPTDDELRRELSEVKAERSRAQVERLAKSQALATQRERSAALEVEKTKLQQEIDALRLRIEQTEGAGNGPADLTEENPEL